MEESETTKFLVMLERIEGKIDRMSDRIKLTEERVEALLDVVTGNKMGAKHGLVVRVMSLEDRVDRQDIAITEAQKIDGRIEAIEDKLDDVLRMQMEHPPLLYLLRYQTKKTVFWIVVAFVILSLWYVSGFRQPILDFLGLPIF